jgi:hypothetical protein
MNLNLFSSHTHEQTYEPRVSSEPPPGHISAWGPRAGSFHQSGNLTKIFAGHNRGGANSDFRGAKSRVRREEGVAVYLFRGRPWANSVHLADCFCFE